MKKKLLLLSFVQCTALAMYAQEPSKTELRPLKPAQTSATPSSKPITNDSLPAESLVHLNAVIDAIDSKVAYIKTDQTENQKAIESGWFDMMAKQRAILVAKKEALIQQQTEQK